MVRLFGGATRCARLPASGLASTATTRSPRSDEKVLPSASVIVVLPTPPFLLITTTRREPVDRGAQPLPPARRDAAPPSRAAGARCRRSPGSTVRCQPRLGTAGRGTSMSSSLNAAAVQRHRAQLGGDARLVGLRRPTATASRCSARPRIAASRQRSTATPRRGSASSATDSEERMTTVTSPASQARPIWSVWTPIASQVRSTMSGRFQSSQPKPNVSSGTTTSTQPTTSRRAYGRSSATRGSVGRPGSMLRSTGRTRANRSGTPARSARM